MTPVACDPDAPVKLVLVQRCATVLCTKENITELPPKAYGEAMRLWNEKWLCEEHQPPPVDWSAYDFE